MTERIVIELSGAPVAKGRPKFARVGKGQGSFVTTYTPGKTRSYEQLLRHAAQQAMAGRPLLTGALTMKVTANLPLLKGFSQRKRQAAIEGRILPVTRPDVDNYAKIALDALNCVVFADDSQVTELTVSKFYDERPRIVIEVQRVAMQEAA